LGSDFAYDELDFDYDTMVPRMAKGSIKIIYRDKVRVFYHSVKEAKLDNYHDYDPKDYPKDSAILYGYTGLRGDAKELHRSILRGEE